MMKAATTSFPSASKPISSRRGRPAKRKQRCWSFLVKGMNKNGPEMKVPDVVASFRERYTAVKRLTLSPASGPHTDNIKTWEGVRATVQFIGPQPSQGPGSLLCQLLAGTSVEAEPIVLGRGRKKRPRSEWDSSATSDYDLEDSTGSSASHLGLARQMTSFYPKNNESVKFPYINFDTTVKSHPRLGPQRAETSLPSTDLPLLLSGLYAHPISTRVPPSAAHTVESDDKGMQWDDVLNRVEPPFLNRGLAAPQHSLDLGGLYVSSDSEDDLAGALADSDDGELISQPISEELWGAAPTRRHGDLTNRTAGALPLFRRSESLIRGWPLDFGKEVLGSQLHHSAAQIGTGKAVQDRDMVRTSAANQSVFFTNSGSGAPLAYPNDTAARAVSFEQPAKMNLPLAPQIMELPRGVSVRSVQTPQECDFDGMPGPMTTATDPIFVNTVQAISGGCRLSFVGLERVGQPLQNLEATAYFRDDAGHEVSSVAGPIQQGPMNRAYATLFYPSMQEIWPEVYGSASVRTVEVDMCVVVRSTDGTFCHIEPGLKVTYRRALVPDEDAI